MHSGRRNRLHPSSQNYQTMRRPADGRRQEQSGMRAWSQGDFISQVDHNTGPAQYVIQKFAAEHADDPFVPSGLADINVSNQQNQNVLNTQSLQPEAYFSETLQQNAGIYANHDDSGYGGSIIQSIDAGQESNGSQLQCTVCNDFKAKNKSELKKHTNRHLKPHKCDISACSKGFATQNDLDRHKRTVHRAECCNENNSIVYLCHHCESQSGTQTTRKQIGWPRKDNFLAHLDRKHSITLSHTESLDKYIVRNRPQPPPEPQPQPQPSPGLRGNNREAAQRNDLTGVGTLPDFINPEAAGTYARQLAHLPGDQANGFMEQRIMKFLQNNSSHLGRSNIFDSFAPSQFISPHMLGNGVNDNLADPSFDAAQAQPLEYFSDPDHGAQTAPQNDHMASNYQYPGDATDGGEIHDLNIENHETEAWIPPHLKLSDSPDPATSESFEQTVPSLQSDIGTGQSVIVDIFNKQLRTAVDSSTSLADQVRSLHPKHREALVAALRAADSNGVEEIVADADAVSKGHTACEKCGKTFNRPCELTKHMKRHSKPYGCTWGGCSKTFGSKNDWKRHESKQHYHLETWKCNQERCPKRNWNRRETFKSHLSKEHNLTDLSFIERTLEECRRGTHCDPNFWCGFCVKYVDVDPADGIGNSWNQRFDHIDNHFCGRDGMEKQCVTEWEYPDSETPCETVESSNIGVRIPAEMTQEYNALRKRKPESMDLQSRPPVKKQDVGCRVVEMWDCCECSTFMNTKTSPSCISCSHVRCMYCLVQVSELPLEVDGTGQSFSVMPAFREPGLSMHDG